ncbi:pyridoxal phosphate-dependent aminotransferase family protein [soil metagenome]
MQYDIIPNLIVKITVVNDLILRMKQKLEERIKNKNIRTLKVDLPLIDFISNDYLGLARSKELKKSIEDTFSEFENGKNGATGSRLLSGNSTYAMELEAKLSSIFQAEKFLLFNSGYNANISILSAVPQRGDTIILDELIHTSLKDGARLSMANHFSFRHNDLADLEKKILRAKGKVFVVAESIYSMDGDICPLPQIIDLCKQNKAELILDEAHATGVQGENGNGLACELNLHQEIFARIYTFGKAMGVHGAGIAGSSTLINYLINFARPFIYTTALPLHALISIQCAFDHLQKNPHLQQNLANKISFFRNEAEAKLNTNSMIKESSTAIQAIIVPGNENVINKAEKIRHKGFDVRPILSPTVKLGQERLRICLHVHNSEEEIKSLVEVLKS